MMYGGWRVKFILNQVQSRESARPAGNATQAVARPLQSSPMSTLRHAHLLARCVLVWLALSIGVAIASPIVKPQGMDVICTGMGMMKLQAAPADDGSPDLLTLTLDCPLCAHLSAPPPPLARWRAEPAQPLAYVLQSIAAAHIASLTAAPLPARGPPALS